MTDRSAAAHLAAIRERLGDIVARHPLNRVSRYQGARIYDEPLVGIAAAADPLYLRLRDDDVIGPHHLAPADWLPGAASVVSYFLPFADWIRAANRTSGMVAEEWVTGRFDGETFNDHMRAALAGVLTDLGGDALVPPFAPRYRIVARRANWSERHTAFIAGLGTFGLSRSMITARGSAGRFGSVVTTLALPPTPRDYDGPYDRCPWEVNGGCGACIERCPSGAIKPEGKDTATCSHYLDHVVRPLFAPRYGCGKCQTAVPCEHGIPRPDTKPMYRSIEVAQA
jgi:epoxyqueuosine reductase QueG